MGVGVIAYAAAPPRQQPVTYADIVKSALIGIAFAVAAPLLLLTSVNFIRLVSYGQVSVATPALVICSFVLGGWFVVLGVRRMNAIRSLLRKLRQQRRPCA